MTRKTLADAVDRLNDQTTPRVPGLTTVPLNLIEATILVRTNLKARQQLHTIALEERSSLQALSREALNLLLISRDKPPIA